MSALERTRPIFESERFKEFVTDFKKDVYQEFEGYWINEDFQFNEKMDRTIVSEILRYPDLHERIVQEPGFREECFKWCFRDKMPVGIFAKHYELAKEISEIALARKTNNIFKGMIQISADDTEVTVPIANSLRDKFPSRINLLNKNFRLVFETGPECRKVSYTVQEILDHFKARKKEGQPEFDVINGVIRPWGPEGSFRSLDNVIDTTKKEWYKLLEPDEILNDAQALERALQGVSTWEDQNRIKEKFNQERAIVRICVTSGVLQEQAEYNHALIEILMHMGNGKWGFYPVGVVPVHYPKTMVDAIPFFYGGEKAVFRYPDKSKQMGGYVQHYATALTTRKLACETFEVIGKMIAKAQSGEIRFHPAHSNCADLSVQVLKEALGVDFSEHFTVDEDQIQRHVLLKRFFLEIFDFFIWPTQQLLRGQLGKRALLPMGLTLRAVKEGAKSPFIDHTPS